MDSVALAPSVYVAALRGEGTALVASARSAGNAAPVPSCPDWTVADLLVHVGSVQRWQTDLVERLVAEPAFDWPTPPEDSATLPEWVADATSGLAGVLDHADPTAAMWTLAGPGVAGFWFRRAAHEVALHRVDLDLAAGTVPVVDAEFARDAIDEFLTMALPVRLGARLTGAGESVHVHCTDTEGEWLVRLTPEGPEVERAHAKGDVAARGSAADLLLALRGRGGTGQLELFGDAALFEAFRSRLAL